MPSGLLRAPRRAPAVDRANCQPRRRTIRPRRRLRRGEAARADPDLRLFAASVGHLSKKPAPCPRSSMLREPMPCPPLLDADLVARRVRVRARDAVFVRGVLEASEGVGVLFAEQGGDLVLA